MAIPPPVLGENGGTAIGEGGGGGENSNAGSNAPGGKEASVTWGIGQLFKDVMQHEPHGKGSRVELTGTVLGGFRGG